MNLYTVPRIVVFHGEGSLKAFCDVQVGKTLLIRGVRIVEGKHGLFVTMPRQQGKDGKWYDAVRLLTPAAKQELDEAAILAYQHELALASLQSGTTS